MGGETSKRSGEFGEKIAKELLKIIGWSPSIKNISIKCNNKKHLSDEGRPRSSHGEDIIFLYNSPFHDDLTHIVHISVKNEKGKVPAEGTLKKKFKAHLKELQETIECCKNSPELRSIIKAFPAKRHVAHLGLLLWFHNDQDFLEYDIKPLLANAMIESNITFPMFLVDNARASFLLKSLDDFKRKSGINEIEFYFPDIGTSIKQAENRTDTFLPLEIIGSDIISLISRNDKDSSLFFYANQKFSEDAYTRLISYALNFSKGLITDLKIGMPDFSMAEHEKQQDSARMHFSTRKENITPFSYKRSILNLIEEDA
ncbi:hypothetical protein SOI69_07915 [Acinetobacter pittii]|uniref:GapS4a family protein n=1 Tax=Acinetobacter pittii TaxID=48296 RepID=UPI002A6A9DB1|nr:hypothetical protein [Acinetobacter pittii]WPP57170.1 hypothetical protein SOI69_07915 [Acinetobacter pittii]